MPGSHDEADVNKDEQKGKFDNHQLTMAEAKKKKHSKTPTHK